MTDETLATRTAKTAAVEDLPLGAAAPDLDEPQFEDASVELNEEDFDFGAFVEGARPTRRAVRVAMRADLLEVLDSIVLAVEDAERQDDQERVDELLEEYERTKAAFEASRRRIVVEGRSSQWRRRQLKRFEREGLTQPGKKAPAEAHTAYTQETLLRLLAGQIVHPTKGVTVEALRHLLETNEPALNQIWQAAEDASSKVAAVSPDFSRGR